MSFLKGLIYLINLYRYFFITDGRFGMFLALKKSDLKKCVIFFSADCFVFRSKLLRNELNKHKYFIWGERKKRALNQFQDWGFAKEVRIHP